MKLPITILISALLFASCREDTPQVPPPVQEPETIPVPPVVAEPRILPEGTSEGPGLSSRVVDRLQVETLVKEGADPAKEHRIEHHLVLATQGQALKAIEWGNEQGFEMSAVQESVFENRKSYGVDFIRVTTLDAELINLDRRRLESFAMSLDVDYDGWGCTIVR